MGESNGALLDAARRYLERGWMPVYVPPGIKGPTTIGWQKQRLAADDLPAHFGRPGNIGLVLGEASGGLVDVDLDCPEAIELADRFLPATGAVTGRPSALRSHRWFISDVPATKQFRDPKTKEMIVELRSTGGQTLVGPSIHGTGEPYDPLEGEPARVPGPALEACVNALYEAVVRMRYGELPEKRPLTPPAGPATPVDVSADVLERRAIAYLDAMPPAISGQGGHNATYTAATALVHGFGIPPDRALEILVAGYNPRCVPPWTEKELRHKVENAAAKAHERPFGWLRDQEVDPERGVDLSALLPPAAPANGGVDLSGLIGKDPTPRRASACELTPEDLFNYDTRNDPNTLLGQRWLCRSGSCLLVGQTGIGKSSLGVQAAIAWALGEPFFGMAPIRPLRSLVIQAENDVGDLAEMFCGVLIGTDRVGMLERIQSQLVFVTETAQSGNAFHPFARGLVEKHRPDLVWIDPLLAFLGGNVSDQEVVSAFLRNGLGAIAQETGIAWFVVHHANKPPRDPAVRNALLSGDYSYLGSGSSELANWARAVLVLQEVENGLFELRAAKRGRRAGLEDAADTPATEIYLQHGKKGICWERARGPEDERQEAERASAQEVMAAMEKGRIYQRDEVRALVERVLGKKKSAVLTRGRPGYRIFQLVLEMTRCAIEGSGHTVTSGHTEAM